jgi:hypothetical protein
LFISKSFTNVLTAVSSVTVLVTIALWQFYVFIAFKDSQGAFDLKGSRLHLWLAIGIALIACIDGLFVFLLFLRYDTHDELPITPGATLSRNIQ